MYSIKEAACMTELPAHTLRYYEECGILTEIERNTNGQRMYSDYNLQQINLIKCLRACKLTIEDIRRFFIALRTHMPAEDRVGILKKHHEYLEKKQKEIVASMELLEIKINYFSK